MLRRPQRFVRYVQIGSNFLSKFNPEEIRILLEVIGGMPKLESLKIHFVPEMVLPAKAVANVLQRAPNLKELHFFDLELAGDEYEMEALGESLEALTSLKKVSFNQLGLEQGRIVVQPLGVRARRRTFLALAQGFDQQIKAVLRPKAGLRVEMTKPLFNGEKKKRMKTRIKNSRQRVRKRIISSFFFVFPALQF